MSQVRWLAVFACAISLPAMTAGCLHTETRSAADVDRKIDNTSYVEEGTQLALVVSTRIAFAREHKDYFPLEVAVVNKGMPALSLTPESFTLVDPEGSSYPVVSGTELRRSINVDVDRRLGTLAPVILSRYDGYSPQSSTFTTSFDKPTSRNVSLPRFSWTIDLLYFPKPPGGVRGRQFELFLKARELEEPVFVRFEVGGTEGEDR